MLGYSIFILIFPTPFPSPNYIPIPRPIYNLMIGFYIAVLLLSTTNSVLYSVDPHFKISLQPSDTQLAHCYYLEKVRESGWNRFYSHANILVDMINQYRGAGYLEGYATYKEIFYAYNNFYKSLVMNGEPNVNTKVKNFVDLQLAWIDEMYAKNTKDLYWQQVYALTEQMRYMYKGFLFRIHQESRLDMYIGFSQFYYLSNMGDLEDLIPAFNQKTGLNQTSRRNCNTFIKLLNNRLYVTQSTFNIYNLMLRFWKVYRFPSIDSRIASQIVAFTARPGDLQSKDDFYLLSSGLAVTQTSLSNFNKSNYQLLKPQTVPTWIRHNVANRLGKSIQQWIDIFLQFRSYTHNNQWQVTDLGKFKKTAQVDVWMVEEGFDTYTAENFTERFIKDGYLASYNVPFSKNVYDKLNYSAYGFDYENDPRVPIFKKYNDQITDYESLKKLLTTNEEEDKCDGIAPRCDLSKKSKFEFGMIDQKICDQDSLENNWIDAISGPPYSEATGMPPFDWKNWPNSPHLGMPDVWNFNWTQLPINLQA